MLPLILRIGIKVTHSNRAFVLEMCACQLQSTYVTATMCRTAHPSGIVLAGRKVLADLALAKDEVRALALDRASGTHGAHDRSRDRRNLYLVRAT